MGEGKKEKDKKKKKTPVDLSLKLTAAVKSTTDGATDADRGSGQTGSAVG